MLHQIIYEIGVYSYITFVACEHWYINFKRYNMNLFIMNYEKTWSIESYIHIKYKMYYLTLQRLIKWKSVLAREVISNEPVTQKEMDSKPNIRR